MGISMAKLIGIAIRDRKRAPMQTLEQAFISMDKGVADDFRGKPGKRQVTVMSLKTWQDVNKELHTDIEWTTRRANLLVDDLELENTTGQILVIGDVELLITGETDPCHRMQEALDGLYDALLVHWRGGVRCRVLSEGVITVGDEVILKNSPA